MARNSSQQKPSTLRFDSGRASPPPIRLKLYLLFGLLIFVLVMMRFANDPKNWRWMGLERRPAVAPVSNNEPQVANPTVDVRLSRNEENANRSDEDYSSSDAGLKLAELKPELAKLQIDFWTRLVRRLDAPSRQRLYEMIRNTSPSVPNGSLSARQNLVARIQQFSDQYATELLAQSAEIESTNLTRKQLWNELLIQWQKSWTNETKPILLRLASKDDDSAEPENAIAELRNSLNDVAKSLVVDDSPIGRPMEVPFWNELVARIRVGELADAGPAHVSHLEMREQPQTLRGKAVALSGRIRAARLQKSNNKVNGVKQYYELWIQPDDGSSIPVCAFALEMPADFPPVTEQLSMMDVSVRLVGYFFKSRSYLTEANKTQFCPVVLTDCPSVTIIAAKDATPWTPSVGTLASILALASLTAAWIAVRVYRSTQLTQRRPSPLIPTTLRHLTNDPDVKSIRERLAHWGDDLDSVSSTEGPSPPTE